MANKSKDIGTKAETAVVRAARTRGFPHADRITLSGPKDRTDWCPDLTITREGA